MRRSALAAVPAVLLLGLSACGGGGYDTKTLKFSEKNSQDFGYSDAPPKTKFGKQGPQRLSPGDVLAFRNPLVGAGGKVAGELDATCAVTHAGTFKTARVACQGTATVPGGQLALNVGGLFGGGATTRGSIVGGTGDYKGAGGTFASTNSNGPSKDTFEIQIPKK
jgi:hypothetical protein